MDEKADNFDQRLKRVRFYEKNGFHITAYYYHEGSEIYQMMANTKQIAIDVIEKLTKSCFGISKSILDKNKNENALSLKKGSIFLALITLTC